MAEHDTTDDGENEIEPLGDHVRSEEMINADTRHGARFTGLTDIYPNFGSVATSNHIYISRASSSGSYGRLSPEDAREMAAELRELHERDSALLDYFTGGGRDDPEEMADALEASADAITTAETLDDEFMKRLRYTLYVAEVDD